MRGILLYGSLLFGLPGGIVLAQTPPPNDNFTNAILLTGTKASFSGTLSNATLETWEPSIDYGPTGSVWWKWAPATNGPVLLQVTPNNPSGGRIDARLDVFRGRDLTNLQFVSDTILDPPAGRFVIQSLYVPTNAFYYFRVSGKWQGAFNGQLSASGLPTIMQQPQSRTASPSGSALFCALAAGIPSPAYQWMFNGTPLPGQTAAILLLHDIQTNAAGGYFVVVSNAGGAVQSATASLSVTATNPVPRVTMLPQTNGSAVQFVVRGERGRWYRFETTDDLLYWWLGDWAWYGRATNEYNLFSVPLLNEEQQFVNVALNATSDGCVAQLEAMHWAAGFFALENGFNAIAAFTLQDIGRYFRGGSVPPCPGNGVYSPGPTVTNELSCSVGGLSAPYDRGHRWP
jgi:hypothetical protein